jgi:hypothetical protein
VTEGISIPTRFRGPRASANGGYACGVLARDIGDAAVVNLRKPPPLDHSLRLAQEPDGAKLFDGEEVVADGAPDDGSSIDVPEPPSMAQAQAAVERYVGFRQHPFPECFVCGPHRDHHDGLHIFPGPVADRDVVASPWTPDPSLPRDDGVVATEVVWAALDCPTGFGCAFFRDTKPAVLARLRGTVVGQVEIGRPHIAIGWPIGQEGRKREGGSALFTLDGELIAHAAGLWIELRE